MRSTISLPLQRAVEATLQEGLWRYERNAGRLQFQGPEASLAQAVKRIEAENLLTGAVVNDVTLSHAGDAALGEVSFLSDAHGSAAYKKELLRVYLSRAVREALS